MPSTLARLALVLFFVAAACNGSTRMASSAVDAGTEGTAQDGGCISPGCARCADAGPADAGGTFKCGRLTCRASEYCTETIGGAVPPDGGLPGASYQCTSIPDACSAAPTCACLKARGSCACVVRGGYLIVTCAAP